MLSVFWLVLVFPATFAQPIALVIKQPGADGYLGVQLLTGFMYIISFISSTFSPESSIQCTNMLTCSVWLLRVWKLRQLENADLLAEAQRIAEEDAGDVTRIPTHRTSRTSTGRMVLRGFLSLRHV